MRINTRNPKTGRKHTVRMATKAIAMTPLPMLLKRFNRSLRVVLYHHIGETCSFTEQLGVSTPPDVFDDHIRKFALDYDVVSLPEVLSGKLPKRPILLTFDDAYRSVLDVAAPILKSHQIKPVFFLCSGPIINGEIILDNMLSHAEIESPELLQSILGLSRENLTKHILLEVMPGRTAAQRLALRDQIAEAMGGDARSFAEASNLYLKPEDVRTLSSEYGFSIGGHTRSHVHVRGIKEEEIEDELTNPLREIENITGLKAEAFSFPFGSVKDGTEVALRHLYQHVQKVFYVNNQANMHAMDKYLFRSSIGSMEVGELDTELETMSFIRALAARLTKSVTPSMPAAIENSVK